MLLLVGVGLFFVGTLDFDVARAAVTAAGAVLTLGWVIGPVFAAGIDTTLDPAKLAPFPMTTRQMMVAITAGGLTGVPGIATTLGALATFLVWAREPVAAIAAVVCVPLGVLICVVASRAVAALAGGLGSGRRTREIVGLVGFLALIFASPLLIGVMNALRAATDQGVQLQSIVDALSWTRDRRRLGRARPSPPGRGSRAPSACSSPWPLWRCCGSCGGGACRHPSSLRPPALRRGAAAGRSRGSASCPPLPWARRGRDR